MEKIDEQFECEIEQIHNMFPNAQFEIAINIEEMDNLVEQLTNAKDKLETISNLKIYE